MENDRKLADLSKLLLIKLSNKHTSSYLFNPRQSAVLHDILDVWISQKESESEADIVKDIQTSILFWGSQRLSSPWRFLKYKPTFRVTFSKEKDMYLALKREEEPQSNQYGLKNIKVNKGWRSKAQLFSRPLNVSWKKEPIRDIENTSRHVIFDPDAEPKLDSYDLLYRKFFNLDVACFMQYGMHIGHAVSNSVFLTNWIILGVKDEISIINLFFTFVYMKISLAFIRLTIRGRKPIWFFNGNNEYYGKLNYTARLCSESSFAGLGWVNGLFTNFDLVFAIVWELFFKILYHGKSVRINRRKRSFARLMQGLEFSRVVLPSLVLATDAECTRYIFHETALSSINAIAVADTNVHINNMTLVVPGNDDAQACIGFYLSVFTRIIIMEKLHLIKIFGIKSNLIKIGRKKTPPPIPHKFLRLALHKPRSLFLKLFSKAKLMFILVKTYTNVRKSIYTNFVQAPSWGFFEKVFIKE